MASRHSSFIYTCVEKFNAIESMCHISIQIFMHIRNEFMKRVLCTLKICSFRHFFFQWARFHGKRNMYTYIMLKYWVRIGVYSRARDSLSLAEVKKATLYCRRYYRQYQIHAMILSQCVCVCVCLGVYASVNIHGSVVVAASVGRKFHVLCKSYKACKMFVCVRVRVYGASNNGNGLLKDHIIEKKGEIINKEAARAAAAALATATATLRQ